MEPTGMMSRCGDKADSRHQKGNLVASGAAYQLCDLGHEEVHFSKDPLNSDHYYSYLDKSNNFHDDSIPSSPTTTNGDFSSGFIGLETDVGAYSSHPYSSPNTSNPNGDQVKSTRLLSYLSSKWKRGSNYLNASKLVGQYLLGITIQNWSEFFNTTRMMKAPGTRHQLTRRLLANLSYFQGNYLCVSMILVLYCILTSPLLLLAIAFYLFALYIVTARSALGKQTKILGHRLNLHQQYSFITMLSLPLLWIAGAPSALFWVIGASFFVVGLHASMYANERALAADLPAASDAPISSCVRLPSSAGGHWSTSTGGSGHPLGYAKLDFQTPVGDGDKAMSSVHYYDHYATTGVVAHRIAHETRTTTNGQTFGLMSSYQGPESSSNSPGKVKRNSAAAYMPIALSQWIGFGAGSRSSFGGTSSERNKQDQEIVRQPEIKIISQDYAGLGRVYEV